MKYIILMMIYMLSYGYSLAQSKVYGDFDGDGKKEYAYLVYPRLTLIRMETLFMKECQSLHILISSFPKSQYLSLR